MKRREENLKNDIRGLSATRSLHEPCRIFCIPVVFYCSVSVVQADLESVYF